MQSLNQFFHKHRNTVKTYRRIKIRSHLNADTLYTRIREDFDKVKDHQASNAKISLSDTLMSGFAMFCLKDPSILTFDERRQEDPDSLNTVFGIKDIHCDSQMHSTLDPVSVSDLRRPFKSVFAQLQRGKVEYYHQMLAGAFAHPERSEVIPTCPEMIIKQNGSTKKDCERNAAKRYLADLRREHPHLNIITLSSNAPTSWSCNDMISVIFSESNPKTMSICSILLMKLLNPLT